MTKKACGKEYHSISFRQVKAGTSISIDPQILEKAKDEAKRQRRSLSSLVEVLILQELEREGRTDLLGGAEEEDKRN